MAAVVQRKRAAMQGEPRADAALPLCRAFYDDVQALVLDMLCVEDWVTVSELQCRRRLIWHWRHQRPWASSLRAELTPATSWGVWIGLIQEKELSICFKLPRRQIGRILRPLVDDGVLCTVTTLVDSENLLDTGEGEDGTTGTGGAGSGAGAAQEAAGGDGSAEKGSKRVSQDCFYINDRFFVDVVALRKARIDVGGCAANTLRYECWACDSCDWLNCRRRSRGVRNQTRSPTTKCTGVLRVAAGGRYHKWRSTTPERGTGASSFVLIAPVDPCCRRHVQPYVIAPALLTGSAAYAHRHSMLQAASVAAGDASLKKFMNQLSGTSTVSGAPGGSLKALLEAVQGQALALTTPRERLADEEAEKLRQDEAELQRRKADKLAGRARGALSGPRGSAGGLDMSWDSPDGAHPSKRARIQQPTVRFCARQRARRESSH